MQTGCLRKFGLIVAVFAVAFAQTGVIAQSLNHNAFRFFNEGLQEKDPRLKLEHYLKALEIDPEFVEAQYNAGLVYKQLREMNNAKQYLINARDSKKSGVTHKLKTLILFHLSSVQKSLGEMAACEQSLLDARKFVDDRSMASQLTFELGRLYFEMQRFPEALAMLKEGQKRFKENSSFFENLITIVEIENQATEIERDIERAIADANYSEAQALVQQLKTIKPGHPGIAQKSTLIDSLLNSKAKRELLKDMFRLAEENIANGNLQKALSTYELMLQNDPTNNSIRQKLSDLRKEYEEKQRIERLQDEYATGQRAIEEKNWTRAIIALEKVIELDPEYQDARSMLREANRRLESESTESIARQYYSEGVEAMSRDANDAALALLEKAYSLNPDYKDTKELVEQLRSEKLKDSRASGKSASDEYFKSLYDQAVASMSEKEWMQAVLTLEKLRYLAPNDHEVLSMLIQAKEKVQLQEGTETTDDTTSSYSTMVSIGGVILLGVILPVFGFFIFSMSSRARLNYLRGNYFKAAQLYERILAKHPERLKLYATLANIYLMLGRNDERAIRVFKMIIDLNIAKHCHAQINTILSQKYLNEGPREDEAIAILENELRAEQENNGSNSSA